MSSYRILSTTLGPLRLEASDVGLNSIGFDAEGLAHAGDLSAACAEAAAQISAYLVGELREFRLRLDLDGLSDFQHAVLGETARILYGETVSYGELARRIGRPGAARAVGGALNRNPLPLVIPCHRVVGTGGALVGYAGGLDRKRALLELERHHT
jgi:methylated-DNA-[protein]-cysteine S-methyltransferase